MACNCQDNHPNSSCDNSISFQLDGSYLVPFCGDASLMPLDLSPIVQESETDTRLQLDQSLRRLVYTGEHAQRGISSPDSISVPDIANLIDINELRDVEFAISSNGDILSYDADTARWVSYAVPNGTIVTPVGVGADGNLVKDGSGGTPQAPDTVPLGGILIWPAPLNKIPVSYRECNGQALSRTVYSDLFDLIGTTYGAGDGSTSFNLPNIQERAVFGLSSTGTIDTQFQVIGQTGGAKSINLRHSHTVNAHNHNQGNAETSADYPNHVHFGVTRGVAASDGRSTHHVHQYTRSAANASPGTNQQLSNNQSILPNYITMPFMMRVV